MSMAARRGRFSWCRLKFMASRMDGRLGISPIRHTYIIRNGHVSPEYKAVKAKTLSIAGRAVSSLIKSQGVGDLYELYLYAQRNKIDYNLAYIPGDFLDTSTQAFDPVYMTKLYDLASAWRKRVIRGRRRRHAWASIDRRSGRRPLRRLSGAHSSRK
jgi:hypothetical protein